jgi:hypothetical protein
MLKRRLSLTGLSVLLALPAAAQSPAARTAVPAAFSEIYHVHFVQAAPGKYAELEKVMTAPAPGVPAPHSLLLRHREGSPWDFVAIEHIGPKATVEAGAPGPARELRASHEDTYVAGPPWDVFAKAMGIDGPGAANAVYVVSAYRGVAGHRAQLDDILQKMMAASAKPDRGIVLQHVEGGPWDSLMLQRYESWQEFASDMVDPAADQRERRAGLTRPAGMEMRDHVAFHADTITMRVVPAK